MNLTLNLLLKNALINLSLRVVQSYMQIIDRLFCHPPLSFSVFQTEIDSQSIEPCRETGLPGIKPQLPIGPDEDLLREILGRLVAARNSIGEAISARVVSLVDR